MVDTNVIAYLLTDSANTSNAKNLINIDNEWHVPFLWRSEFLNVLTMQIRHSDLKQEEAYQKFIAASDLLANNEHYPSSKLILNIVSNSKLSSYDAEFIALAKELNCKLVTLDKKILSEFPEIAISLLEF